MAAPFYLPLVGRSENVSAASIFRVGVLCRRKAAPPPEALRASTSPQGGGEKYRLASLLCGFEDGRWRVAAGGFDLGGFLLAKLDDVIDELLVAEFVGRLA